MQRPFAPAAVLPQPTDVKYINAHGTSTAYNDKFETMAIKQAWIFIITSHPVIK